MLCSGDGPVAPVFRFSYLGGLWLYDRTVTFRIPPLPPSLLPRVPLGSVAPRLCGWRCRCCGGCCIQGSGLAAPPALSVVSWEGSSTTPGRGQTCRGAIVTGSSATSGVVELTGATVGGQGPRVTEASMATEMGLQLCRCLFSCGCGCSCILEA